MGLACSHAITKALEGEIKLLQSEQNLTAFQFMLPCAFKVAGWRHQDFDVKENTDEMKFVTRKQVGLEAFSRR